MSPVARLLLVRHGQSVGNVADERARSAGAGRLDLDFRDADTPLSDDGAEQAASVGRYFAALPAEERPTVWLSSPYRRAADTAAAAVSSFAGDVTIVHDERLRERDLGILDGYTGAGIRERFPEEAERRDRIGKFYYRPPGGESWTDVVLRVRSVLADLRLHHPDEHVCVFAHQAVIMAFRYVLEGLDEESVLRIDRDDPLPNCSLTSYRRHGDELALEAYADTAAVRDADAPTTREEPTHDEETA